VPVVEIEHDSVGTRLGPAMLAENCCCADHEGTLHLKPVASSFETALRASSG
jgi:hypothetical protein